MRRIPISMLTGLLVLTWVSTPADGRSRRAAARARTRPAKAATAPATRATAPTTPESRAASTPPPRTAEPGTPRPRPLVLEAEPEVLARATAAKKTAKRMMHAGIGLSIAGLVITAVGATIIGVGPDRKGMVLGGTVALAVGTASAVTGVVVWAVGAKRYERAERLIFDSMTRKVMLLEPLPRREPLPGAPPPAHTVLAWSCRF